MKDRILFITYFLVTFLYFTLSVLAVEGVI